MIQITSLTNSFILNGRLYQKGSLTFTPTPNGLSVSNFSAKLADIEIDGETFDTMEGLQSALDEKVFYDGGGSGSGATLQVATIEDMQEGTNDFKYVTPLKTHQFVEWFSSQLLLRDTSVTEPLTSSEINDMYPEALVRTLLYLPNVGSGLKYTKISDTEWESQPYTVA